MAAIDVGANQAALLKKVEELTLYIIEQNKKIDALTEQNKKLGMLETRLKQLEKNNQ
jgi:small-conductance mechanosensitive channel